VKIGSLFSGYGGLDMGVMDAIGGEVAWHVEYDRAPSKILAHHWPDIPNYGDITTVDWSNVPPVDVLTGGYPCQPFSLIGKRKGKDDARHLWPYVATAIRDLRPNLAVLENVAGHLTLGFGSVLGDLAEIGYDARWVCLSAATAGAPHRRDRIFIVAHPQDQSRGLVNGNGLRTWREKGDRRAHTGPGIATHTNDIRGDGHRGTRKRGQEPENTRTPDAIWGRHLGSIRHWERVSGRHAPWPGYAGGGVTTEFTEWMMGLPAGHVTSPSIGLGREQQAKAIGNGVVPQQASLALRTLLTA
jgi:DNA (cytosine-5)-methyltransferase 1